MKIFGHSFKRKYFPKPAAEKETGADAGLDHTIGYGRSTATDC